MIIDSKTTLRNTIYEDGTITITRMGSGNRKTGKGGRALGKKQKFFDVRLNKKIVRSTIINQFNNKVNRIIFCTLTFTGKVDNSYANECFSKYLDNLYENYNLQSHVAVKELHLSGNPHFHCFFDMPFKYFSKLNRAWCHTFSDRLPYSKNAFTTGKRKTITNVRGAAKYAAKYVSKTCQYENIDIKLVHDYRTNRIFFCSHNVLSHGHLISDSNTQWLIRYNDALLIAEGDYFEVWKLQKFHASKERIEQLTKKWTAKAA